MDKSNENKLVPLVNEVVAAVLSDRSSKDDEFAQALRSDPKGLLSEVSSRSLDPGMKVHIVHNTDDAVYVPLPAYSILDMEDESGKKVMSDQDMRQIAGGEIFALFSIFAAIGAVAGVSGTVVGAAAAVGAGAAVVGTVGVGAAVGTGVGIAKAQGRI